MNSHKRMPVVGRCNFHGIDILALKKLFILLICIASGSNSLGFLPIFYCFFESLLFYRVNIGTGYHLQTFHTGKAPEIGESLTSKANGSEKHSVAWRNADSINYIAGKDSEPGQSDCRQAEEIPPVHSLCRFFFHMVTCI